MRGTKPLLSSIFLAAVVAALHPAEPADAGARRSVPGSCRHPAATAAEIDRLELLFTRLGVLSHGPPWLKDLVRRFLEARRIALQDCVRLNEVQVLGTHNSYHVEPQEPLFSFLLSVTPQALEIQYTHPPLVTQFDDEGIRQIEIDVWTDPQGGLFAHRFGDELVGRPPFSTNPDMYAPGFKVIHIPDIDFVSTCETFVACLREVRAWSDAHPRHLPIAVLVELKDDPPFLAIPAFAVPLPIGAADLDALDAEIRSVFPADELLTPDDVRGGRTTLEEAVRTDGWPTLGEARGRVLFLMDNGDPKRALYRAGRPSLEGRVLFTNAVPGDADAAFVKLNDPLPDPSLITDVVRDGYLVRTRADADTHQARSGDTTQRDAALASGAQYVSTDYPVPDPRFGTGYRVEIPGGAPARCNPVNSPTWCRSELLETPGP
ncbi:MAG TPA: phosphatidylinositol-specific phospholipase C1-like protein [Myxococcota bacterium]|jgi:hypothetical protein|nr:phosphatidylinositol-specific phospholipase C1-like protein [Myxococcota bacterium]